MGAAKNKDGLTIKQEHFCQMYFECRSGAAAYRASYDADKMSPGAVHTEAYKLLQDPHVTRRIEELRIAIRERTEVSLTDHLTELERLRDIAVVRDEISAAIKAESLRGDALGYYVQKKETGKPGAFGKRTPEEIKASIMTRNVRLGVLKLVPQKKDAGKSKKKVA